MTHLRVKSGYSFMKSTIKLSDYIAFAKENQIDTLALTDHNVLYGAYQFYQLCLSHQIKPVIGLSLSVQIEDRHEDIMVYSKNYNGYQALLSLSSTSETTKEPVSYKLLQTYEENIKVIVPLEILKRSFNKSILEIDDMTNFLSGWPLDTYLGLTLSDLKREEQPINDQCVWLSDVAYLHPEDKEAYQYLREIDKKKPLETKDDSHHFLTNDELLAYIPEVLRDQTSRFIADCHIVMPPKERLLPKFPLPENTSPQRYLRRLCEESLKNKYGENIEAAERMQYELAVIEKMGFSDYFLIVSDFIRYAREEQIMVGPGRGSAAGSIVSYLLDITRVDPLQYDLLFERFLNPERVTMPDIDIDFSDYGRAKVIDYVKQKYGREHVAQIGTFGTFKVRSTIRELAKVFGLEDDTLNYILKLIPHDPNLTLTRAVKESSDLFEYIKQSDELKDFFRVARVIEDLPRNLSTHAAGVVIYHDRLTKHTPLTLDNDTQLLTQYNMTDLESIGLLKIDFLGLKNLTLIEHIVKDIKKKYAPDFVLDEQSFDDSQVYQLLQKGRTLGVFQLESKGMQETLVKLKPTHFEDIVAVNALYRPGPMDFIETYTKRKEKREDVTYLHPDLKPILKDTYGVLVYQEQIMRVAHQFAGLSFGEADILRRAVSKKNLSAIEKAKEMFTAGCLKKGYDKKIIEEIFSWILKFANYGFNRSHAVSYSIISYQLAYLKVHFPKSFYTALLNDAYGSQEKLTQYSQEVKQAGITMLAPNINQSLHLFTSEKQGVRMGLKAIKGLSYPVIDAIVKERREAPFQSLYDFCLRVPLDIVKRKDIETLVLAGAFDIFDVERAALLQSIDAAIENGTLFGDIRGDIDWLDGFYQMEERYPDAEPMPLMEKLSFEKALVGMYVSKHPLEHYRGKIRQRGAVSLTFLTDVALVKQSYETLAFVEEVRVIRTKRGESMAFIQLSDENNHFEMVIFPEQFRAFKHILTEDQFVWLRAKIEERQGKKQGIIDEVKVFDFDELNQKLENSKTYYIQVEDIDEKQVLAKMRPLAVKYPGSTPVLIYFKNQHQLFKLKPEYFLKDEYKVINQLKRMFGDENIKEY